MTFLVERLEDLRRHLDHLNEIRSRVTGPKALELDLSLHNDVLFSLLVVCQAVIDIASELATRNGLRFQDYSGAVRTLASHGAFPQELVDELALIPGFRNVLVHEYVQLDFDRVLDALERLGPIRRFAAIVAGLEAVE